MRGFADSSTDLYALGGGGAGPTHCPSVPALALLCHRPTCSAQATSPLCQAVCAATTHSLCPIPVSSLRHRVAQSCHRPDPHTSHAIHSPRHRGLVVLGARPHKVHTPPPQKQSVCSLCPWTATHGGAQRRAMCCVSSKSCNENGNNWSSGTAQTFKSPASNQKGLSQCTPPVSCTLTASQPQPRPL